MSLVLVRPSCPGSFFLPDFLQLSCYYSWVYFLLLHFCCFHARSILCGIHTSCMGSWFPAVHTRWSLVFLSELTSMAESVTIEIPIALITNIIITVLNSSFLFFRILCRVYDMNQLHWIPIPNVHN